jgi:hypothetical protein
MRLALRDYLDASRLLLPSHMPLRRTVNSYDVYAAPILRGLDIKLEFVEVYSAEKQSELVTIDDQHYLVFDHALSEALNQLNSLARLTEVDDFIAAALHRALAEALRKAGEGPLYAFFVRRALEVKSIVSASSEGGVYSFDILWQNLFIIYHEAAHGLGRGNSLRDRLLSNASLMASTMMGEVIAALTGTLLKDVLDEPSGTLARDLHSWLATKDDLGLGDESIHAAVTRVATDARFLDELACDAFAIACVLDNLSQRRANYEESIADDIAVEAITACYRTFLNMRLLQYIDDVARGWRDYVGQTAVNPLNLGLLVEMLLRSNAFVLGIVGRDTGAIGPAAKATLPRAIAEVQESHNDSLMAILNELLERTLLKADFHAGLDQLLIEDGFDPILFATDPMAGFKIADAFWRMVAS